MPSLLNHLLDCREASGRERGGDTGGQSLPTADSILRAEAVRARVAGEAKSAEQWYRAHGILSLKREHKVKRHEAQPSPELASHEGRIRNRVINRLARAEMLESTDE